MLPSLSFIWLVTRLASSSAVASPPNELSLVSVRNLGQKNSPIIGYIMQEAARVLVHHFELELISCRQHTNFGFTGHQFDASAQLKAIEISKLISSLGHWSHQGEVRFAYSFFIIYLGKKTHSWIMLRSGIPAGVLKMYSSLVQTVLYSSLPI